MLLLPKLAFTKDILLSTQGFEPWTIRLKAYCSTVGAIYSFLLERPKFWTNVNEKDKQVICYTL